MSKVPTKKQQIQILELAISKLGKNYEYPFLCNLIPRCAVELGFVKITEFNFLCANNYIPLFTFENAKPFMDPLYIQDCTTEDSAWWVMEDYKSRIKFCKWMIKQLKGGTNE